MIELSQIKYFKATESDIPALTKIMTRSFDNDTQRFRDESTGGPQGYNDGSFFRQWMRSGNCFKIMLNNTLIGAFIVFKDYPQKGSNVLGTIFLDPEYQDQGIGTYTMNYVHSTFSAKRWMLDTPEWHTRNHHFYEKLGYKKIGEKEEPHAGFILRVYQKEMKESGSGSGERTFFWAVVL